MVMHDFKFARAPEIHFGSGTIEKLPQIAAGMGKNALIVTGGESLKKSGRLDSIIDAFEKQNIQASIIPVSGEPSPEIIDDAVAAFRHKNIEVVVGIGGGSAVDAGKAISAMLTQEDSIINYLEGIGTKSHKGVKLPYIAVPTTAGTGSEATKNAVISRTGANGFKKSLRHNNFVPDVALVDPELAINCPAEVAAASGLDAITQLLESYTSAEANPMTDALAWSGLQHAFRSYPESLKNGKNINARSAMAYSSLLSGISLANAGLGIVHGFASVIGGYFNIPHGVVCGTLFAESIRQNIFALQEIDPEAPPLKKYARAGYLACGKKGEDIFEGWTMLLDKLGEWTKEFDIPTLSHYGIKESDADRIVSETTQKNNPVVLSEENMKTILINRL